MRRGRFWIAWVGLTMLGTGLAAPLAQTTSPATLLTADVTIEHTLAGGARDTFDIRAAAGDYVRAHIDERGVNVTVDLVAPDGRHLLTTQTNLRPYGREVLAWIAEADGMYRVFVTAADAAAPAGRIVASLQQVRPATSEDRLVADGMRDFERAVGLRSLNERTPAADGRAQVIAAFEAAREGFARAGETWGESRVSVELAAESLLAERADRVQPLIGRAMALCVAQHDDYGLALAHLLSGLAYLRAGQNEAGHAASQRAYELAVRIGDLPTATLAINNVGILLNRLGDAEGAYDAFDQARALRARTGLGMSDAALQVNLGRVAQVLGRLDDARAMFAGAVAQHRAAGEVDLERVAEHNLADVLRRQGNLDEALRVREQSLLLARSLHDPRAEALALEGLGGDLFASHRFTEAEARLQEALERRRAIRDIDGEAVSLLGLGETLHALGRTDEALAALQQALTLRQRFESARAMPPVWRAIGALERDRGHMPEAIAAFEQALAGVERLRDALTSPALRASFTASEDDTYSDYVDLLMQAAQAGSDPSLIARAFEASDHGRARMLLEGLLAAGVDARTGVPPLLLDEERTRQQALATSRARLSQLLGGGAAADDIANARRTLTQDSEALDRLQARIRRESPARGALMQPPRLTLPEVQRDIMDSGTVLLEYQLGRTRSWLWAVTSSGIEAFALPPRATIEDAVRSVRTLYEARLPRPGDTVPIATARVRAADAALPRATSALSRLLFAPIASRLSRDWSARRLAIVAGDALGYVPYAALPLPGRTQRLGASHEIVVVPSVSTLVAMRSTRLEPQDHPTTVAIVADPVFDDHDPRVARTRVDGHGLDDLAAPGGHVARVVRLLSPGAGPRSQGLARLAFSRGEAEAIRRLGRPGTVRVAMDFDANRDTVTAPAIATADIVHLATHALVSPDEPALTGLVVSLVDRNARTRDGFLRLNDIYNLRLQARLVVLSACQTALGQEVRGEGLVGLTRGFMHAGATQVIASLWPVDDAATAELMTRFYRGVLREGRSAAAALQAAQRGMAADPQWAAPYFWAGFVLQGDWR